MADSNLSIEDRMKRLEDLLLKVAKAIPCHCGDDHCGAGYSCDGCEISREIERILEDER